MTMRILRIHPSPTFPPRMRQHFSEHTDSSPAAGPHSEGSLNEWSPGRLANFALVALRPIR